MIKKYYSSFVLYSKKHFEENKKIVIINWIIFVSLIISLVLIDQLTKSLLFTWSPGPNGTKPVGDGVTKLDIGFLGIRSVANYGVTFLSFIPTWAVNVFSVIIFIVCFVFALYSNDKLFIVAIAFTFTGTLGNFIDRVMFDGAVRDILFIPWFKNVNFINGTFNFADVWLFAGSIIAIIYLIILFYRNHKYNKF